MKIGIIGLGRMGMNMARRLLKSGHQIVAHNRSPGKIHELAEDGAISALTLDELVDNLATPRVVWLMLPAGEVIDQFLEQLKGMLSAKDIIVEGGNSYYKDDIRRAGSLASSGIDYIDAGVSGGIWGLKIGYCLMLGGGKKAFNHVEPIFKDLAPKRGYLHCGPTGSGHFVKMVHNGIEYGMMQAYAEGFEILEASPFSKNLDYSKLASLWNQGSVIRSWLLELLGTAFEKDQSLEEITGHVADSGEGRWTVQQAIDTGVPVPVIAESLFRRFRSRQRDSFSDRVLAALRREFGGHAVVSKKDK
jgi:6-phosphogluconate dehydrogenase